MLGLSYAQFYRSHRGVLLLSLSIAFSTASPVPSPSSRLCVPQLHLSFQSLNPCPSTRSLLLLLLSSPFYPTLTSSDLYPSSPPLRRRTLVPFPYPTPSLPLLYYLITCFLSCPSVLPHPLSSYLLSLHPTPTSTHNNSRSVPHCRLSFSPTP